MEKVASHINEMQKIYEDYGTVFDQLVAQQSGPEKEVTPTATSTDGHLRTACFYLESIFSV